jgi:uncharacterized repeat protein (TIGR01451 family)
MSVEKIRSEAVGHLKRFARRRVLVLSALISFVAIGILGVATAYSACVGTAYSVTTASTPPTMSWTDASKWSSTLPGTYPGQTSSCDTASDTNAVQTVITLDTTVTIAQLTLTCPNCELDIPSGKSLTLTGSGNLGGSGKINLMGGTLVIANGGNISFGAPNFQMSSGEIDVQAGGAMNVASGASISVGGGLVNNAGTITLTDGASTLTFQSGSELDLNGGTVNGGGILNNKGVVQNTGGTSSIASQYVAFSSASTAVTSGTLSISGGGSSDAPITIGGTLDLPAGSFNLTTAGVVSGAGTLQISGGALNIGGVTSPKNFNMSAGTLDGDGFLSVSGTMNWNGGTITDSTGNGHTELTASGVGNWNGTVGMMVLDNRVFNDYGYVNFNSPPNPLDLEGSATLVVAGTFDIQSDSSITTGACCLGAASMVLVTPNGIFEKSGGTGLSEVQPATNNNSSVFASSGILDFTGGGLHNGFFFTTATLEFGGNTSFGANSFVQGPGEVAFDAGSIDFGGNDYNVGLTSIFGANLSVLSSMVTTDLTFDSGSMQTTADFIMTGTGTWSSGTISSAGGKFIVDTGSMLTIDDASGETVLDAAKFENDGTVRYTAGTVSVMNVRRRARTQAVVPLSSPNELAIANGSLFTNNGTFDVQGDQPITNTAPIIIMDGAAPAPVTSKRLRRHGASTETPSTFDFVNNGTFEKTGGTGQTDFSPTFQNNGTLLLNAGTLNFVPGYTQTATGTTTLNGGSGGSLKAAAPIILDGGVFNGGGTVTGDITNNGAQIAPGTASTTATIMESGNYTQNTGAKMTIKLAGAALFDVFNVSNSVTLAGIFEGKLIGGYQPANAASFTVFDFASRTGDFAAKNLDSYPPHGTLSANYTSTSLVITAAVTGASADLAVVVNGPATVNAGAPLAYTATVSSSASSVDTTSGTISVANTLPSGASAASGTGTGWSCGAPSGGVISCTTTSPLAPGGSLPAITFNMTAPPNGGSVTDSATVTGPFSDPNPSNNTSSASTTVIPPLTITKTGPASANTGQNITYTVTVKNQGPTAANSVTVTDVTPTGLAFISNSGDCTNAYPCNLGTVNAGQTKIIMSTYSIPSNFAGTSVTNTANVSSSTGNNTSSATTTVGPQTDLSLTKSGPTIATTGQNIVYTIVVTNGGGTDAPNVVVSDPTPAGLTFVSNSGACATPFPCNLGTLLSNQSATITATFNIPSSFSGSSVTNTATVSSSIGDPNNTNNTAAFTSTVVPPNTGAPGADLSVTKSSPNGTQANPGQTITFNIDTFNGGPIAATSVVVTDPTPAGLAFVSNSGACATPFPCNIGTIAAGQFKRITATYTVTATVGATITNVASATSSTSDPNNTNNTGSTQLSVVAPGTSCNNPPPLPIAPGNGAVVASPVAFSWSATSGASSYVVAISGGGISPLNLTTSGTTISASLPNGSFLWSVTAVFANNNCPATTSQAVAFTICTPPAAPVASVVGESTSGQTYTVQWPDIGGAAGYELQESTEPAFANPTSTILTATFKTYLKTASVATPAFYRVRALACGNTGVFSPIISVVVVPLPGPHDKNIDVNVPAGSTTPVVFTIFIPGLSGPASFAATTDKPWLSVVPTNGIVPPEGVNLTLSVDPTGMINGTFTGTVIVAYGTPAAAEGRARTEVTKVTSIPISISLVTPVTPAPLSAAAGALVVPSTGHLGGSSPWQSDIRVSNVSPSLQKYQVTFNDGTAAQNASVKQTIVSIDGGATMALDDIVRNWFGVGSLGDAASGILLIQQLDASGKVNTTDAITKTTVVTSRTYNVSSATAGTLGQFVPVIPFANFLANSGAAASLQQLAQSADYRTNLGIAEAAGKSANVNVNAFDALGKQLFSLPLTINAGESRQLNALFTQNGVSSLSNGRVEVKVTGGEGRVTPYASVIDNTSNDPFLVPPVTLSAAGANRYVIAGVGDITSPAASWRSDLRVFNAGTGPQTTTLTFYPLGNPAAAVAKDVSIVPGEVRALDNLLQSLFGMTNVSGSLHVTTASNSPLVVTSRTFDQTTNGTLGQFITAVTPADAVGAGDRSLQVLQTEDSPRYRTNVGIVEVSGKPATAEITVVLADSKVSPKLTVPLAAFEARQIPVLSSLGLGNVYNARISVKVTDGSGKITAYGSVLDMTTQAPTYIPAQ